MWLRFANGAQVLHAANAPVIVATGRNKPLPVGAYLPYREAGNTLHVWNWSKSPTSRIFKEVPLLPYDNFALSPDGKTLVRADGRVLDLETSAESKIGLGGEFHYAGHYHEHTRIAKIPRITSLEFTPDGKRLLVRLDDLDLRPSDHPLRERDMVKKPILQLVAFPSGCLLCELPAGIAIAYSHDQRSVFIATERMWQCPTARSVC
ncbi:MAG: hypothetical protein H8E66_30515 [Planctomycetes bacterium]|nr:hypothetical protein [Planctomycetota bacterium]